MLTQTLAFVAAIALGLTFLASSVGKLRNPGAFVIGVLDYQVLPPRLAIAYARVLPFVELACGLALVVGIFPVGAGIASIALLLSFLIAVSANLARGRRLDCHCFGPRQSEPLGWPTLARLCVLLVCAAIIVGWRARTLLLRPPADAVPAALLALGVVLSLYLVGGVPVLWRLWRTPAIRGRPASGGRICLRCLPLMPSAAVTPLVGVKGIDRR